MWFIKRLLWILIPLAFRVLTIFQVAVNAALVNITVDDAGVDPITGHSFVFSPEGAWNQGNGCSFCSTKPDAGQMHDGTWQDGTYVPNIGSRSLPTGPLNISLTFSGSAIYVFCAVQTFTNMAFFIDNKQVNQFSENGDGFTYNVPVFKNTGLSPGEHVFTLMNGAIDGSGNESLVLFDYIIYSQEDSTSSQGSAPSPSPQSAPLPAPLILGSALPPSQSVPSPLRSTPLPSQSTPLPLRSATLSPQSAPLPSGSQSAPLPSVPQSAPLPSQSTADSKTESSSKLKPGAIGGIIAAIVVVSILVAIFFWRRHQNNLKVKSDSAMQPFDSVLRMVPGDSLFTIQGPSVNEKRGAVGISPTNGATMPSTRHAETIAASLASSSSLLPLVTSDTLPHSSPSSLSTRPGQVETDAGPLLVNSSARTVEDTLPPDYNQVLAANQRLQER